MGTDPSRRLDKRHKLIMASLIQHDINNAQLYIQTTRTSTLVFFFELLQDLVDFFVA